MKKVFYVLIIFACIWCGSSSFAYGAKESISISIKKEKGAPYLKWNKVNGADGYEVRIADSKNGIYRKIATTTGNRYQSEKLISAKPQYCQVAPYQEIEGKRQYFAISKRKKLSITKVKLKAKCVMQLPQLKTGCEATALTTVLNYHGFPVKKTTIVDQYMPIRRKGFGNINQTFLGNPYGVGMGIYPPGLRKTANRYLEKKNTKLRAYDISGSSITAICDNVAKGNPVCVWVTCNINKKPQTHIRWTYKGKKYSFSYDEHCVAVIGFNRKKDTVIVANPLNGICSYPRKTFAKRYKEMGKRALVIR